MLIKSKEIEYTEKQTRKFTGFVQSDFRPESASSEKSKPEVQVPEVPAVDNKAEEERKIQAAVQEAFDRGLAEGMIRGSEVEKKKLVTAIRAMEKTVGEMLGLRKKILEKLEPEILDLSLSIAEKVIHHEVKTNKEVFFGVLKEAVRNILDREGMKIRLNPTDYEYLVEIKPDILSSFEGVKDPVFEKDEAIAQGGVIVESLFGEVDARLEMQFAELKSALNQKG